MSYAQTLIKRLAAIPGFVDVDTAQAQRKPEVQVVIDRQKAADLGVRVGDVASTLRTLVGGEKVGFYREGGEQYDVRLRLAEDFRQDGFDAFAAEVPATGGRLVRLDNATRLARRHEPRADRPLRPGATDHGRRQPLSKGAGRGDPAGQRHRPRPQAPPGITAPPTSAGASFLPKPSRTSSSPSSWPSHSSTSCWPPSSRASSIP